MRNMYRFGWKSWNLLGKAKKKKLFLLISGVAIGVMIYNLCAIIFNWIVKYQESSLEYKLKEFEDYYEISNSYLSEINANEDLYHKFQKQSEFNTVQKIRMKRNLKYILFWTPYFSARDYNFGFGRKQFLNYKCPVSQCFTTDNRTLLKMSDFDAVMFHSQDIDVSDLPKLKFSHQQYVFYTMESLQNDIFATRLIVNITFDIKMTYRLDSDISLPYLDPICERNTDYKTVSVADGHFKGKTKLCAWFVSKCYSNSRRENIYKELSKYIDIDMYGECGILQCRNSTFCNEMLRKEYKFYLSFENSLCPDYVTEKLDRALQLDVVPVVYGGANYTQFAPPNSYINVRDFSSIQSLANYLLEVSKNETAYNKYFEWKEKYYFCKKPKSEHVFCKLCEMLHKKKSVKKNNTNEDFRKWWMEDRPCEDPVNILSGFNITK